MVQKKKWAAVNGKKIASFGLVENEEPELPSCAAPFRPTRWQNLPARVDLRQHLSTIEDQADTNSCAACAAGSAYEYLLGTWAKYKNQENPMLAVSRFFIYYIGRKRDLAKKNRAHCKLKDIGMTLTSAMDAMHEKGTCRDDFWPFDLDFVNMMPPKAAFDAARPFKISESEAVPVDLTAMKAALADGYPIITGLKLTKAFFNPGPSGKIATPNPKDPKSAAHGLHAMLIVGYSDRFKRFIYRNSWGLGWADKGYGYIHYDYAANPKFNYVGQYIIKGLDDLDMVPIEDTNDDVTLFDDNASEDGGGDVEEGSDDENGEDEDDPDFDPDMFNEVVELKRVFDTYDWDRSGRLEHKELHFALNLMGKKVKLHQIQRYIDIFDQNKVGSLGFPEFCAIFGADASALEKREKRTPLEQLPKSTKKGIWVTDDITPESAKESFERFDRDGSGYLQTGDLCVALNMHKAVAPWDVPGYIEKYGDKEKGAVDFDGYCQILGLKSKTSKSSSDNSAKLEELKACFERFDRDRSGYLETGELCLALHSAGQTSIQPWDVPGYLEKWDSNGQNKLNFNDFCRSLGVNVASEDEVLGSSLTEELKVVFERYDRRNSNVLEAGELCLALSAMGQSVQPWDLQNYISKWDSTGKGSICFADFCRSFGAGGEVAEDSVVGSSREGDGETKAVFERFDRDGTQCLESGELCSALNALGIILYPWDVQMYIVEFDSTKTGNIVYKDFCRICDRLKP